MKRILLLMTTMLLVSCGGTPSGGDGGSADDSPYTSLNPDKAEDLRYIEAVGSKNSETVYSLAKNKGSFRYDVSEESKYAIDGTMATENSHVNKHHEYVFDGDNGFYAYETWADGTMETRVICFGTKSGGVYHYTQLAYGEIGGVGGWQREEKDTTSDIGRNYFKLSAYASYSAFDCMLFALYSVESEVNYFKNDQHIKVVVKGEYFDGAGYSKAVMDYTYIADLDGLPVSIDSKVTRYDSEDKATFAFKEEQVVKASFEYGVDIERKNPDTKA
ncbi:MAG: hypothetical protein J6A47_04160 [Bacilli bacterium]|nr:hypothetical protein [Bacilli bacterium]